ncbi:MAG: proton-conducting transporter membrane subunit [Gemmataceae bacterium]
MGETRAGKGEAAMLAALVALAAASAVALVGQTVTPQPLRMAGLTVDRLSAALTLLVAGVGAVTFRYSLRYLDGETGQRQFLRWLFFTVAMAYLLMLATNLILLFVAWSLTSFGLHRLLTHYPDRREAMRPARKKFLISRLGDVALLAAFVLIAWHWGTLDLAAFLDAVRGQDGGLPATAVALLVVIGGMTKSAQFPFHSWLPETMEAPTPVSALMHAGIINAGGAMLLRFAPLLAAEPEVLLVLVTVGTLTAALGMVAMWAQAKVKRTLAWSTVSQMGFMMVQCGLAAFPAALLHILGHGCYKAWKFLRSGELEEVTPYSPSLSPGRALAVAALGTAVSVPCLAAAAWLTGFSPWHSPGELALTAVVALAIGQLWVGLFRAGSMGLATAVPATLLVSVAGCVLYRGAGLFLAPVLGELPAPAGPLAWMAAVVPVVALVGLIGLHAALPALSDSGRGRALHVHALHGFYFGVIADRVVDRVWNGFSMEGVQHG